MLSVTLRVIIQMEANSAVFLFRKGNLEEMVRKLIDTRLSKCGRGEIVQIGYGSSGSISVSASFHVMINDPAVKAWTFDNQSGNTLLQPAKPAAMRWNWIWEVDLVSSWQRLQPKMAASTVLDFDKWLSVKLKSLNTDESIFGDYIKGILEGEESQDEKIEALEGILVEISTVKWLLSFFHRFHIRCLMICLTNYRMHNADRWHDSKWDLSRNHKPMGVVPGGCCWREIRRGGENSRRYTNCKNHGATSPHRCPPEEGIWWRKEAEAKHLVAIRRGIYLCMKQ